MTFSHQAMSHFIRTMDWEPYSANGMLSCATYAAASCAILQAFGPEWCEKHIGRSPKACDYFAAKKDDYHGQLRHLSRVIEFGELIYNLHDVGGFDERIGAIRTDERTGVESGIAELIAGRFLKMADVMFHYVSLKPDAEGKKPRNPDIEYVAGANRVEACEVKCNLLSTELNERSMVNAAKNAKDQLPKGGAGIILLRVPETWLVDMKTGTTVIEQAIDTFIKKEKTTRVSSVFVFASETRFLPDAKMARSFLVRECRNEYCRLHAGISARDIELGGAGRWRTLEDFADGELKALGLGDEASRSRQFFFAKGRALPYRFLR